MSTACPRCQAMVPANTRFCTSCGALLESLEPASAQPNWPQQGSAPAQASWQQGSASAQAPWQQGQQQIQAPPTWASANPGGYQQSAFGGQAGQASNNTGKQLLKVGIGLIIGVVVVLFVLGLLAWIIPGARCFLGIVIILILLIPWFIYNKIRNTLRRTIGDGLGGLF